jgi:hypothetical protein
MPLAHIEFREWVQRAAISDAARMIAKNADYGSSMFQPPVLAPHLDAKTAILVRLSDKIARMQTLMSGNAPKVDESLKDTIRDARGYLYGLEYEMYEMEQEKS